MSVISRGFNLENWCQKLTIAIRASEKNQREQKLQVHNLQIFFICSFENADTYDKTVDYHTLFQQYN